MELPKGTSFIVGYIRKSRQEIETEIITGNDTLLEQRNLITDMLSNYNVQHYIFKEVASGDEIKERPIFQKVLTVLETSESEFQVLAVKDLTRLGRGSYRDIGRIYDLIIDKNVFILTPNKLYNPSNPNDLMQIRFELFLSREEYESIKERMLNAKYGYSYQGKFMSSIPPYGYIINEFSKKIEPNEVKAEHIKLIYNLYVIENLSLVGVKKALKKLKILSPNGKLEWHTETLRRILLNPVYIGTIRYRMTKRKKNKITTRPKEEWIITENAHFSLISKELFYCAQQKLHRN